MLPLDNLPTPASPPANPLLAGVTVVDLTTSIAGPYATMLLADMGARVIKVERPGKGDDCRAWGPPWLDGESLWFLSVNRNKESVTLDYSGDAGRKVLHDMVKKADVVIVNLVERVQKKLGIDYAALKAVKPDLVFVSLTGFGLTGARKDFPCYDLIAEGYSGVMDLTGEADSPPQKVGTPAADLISGMDAAMATLAALFDRAKTGRGHHIDIAMVDSMTRFMAPRIVPYLGSGEVPQRTGAKDSVIAVYQAFDTQDKPLTLGLGNDAIWQTVLAGGGAAGKRRGCAPCQQRGSPRRARRNRRGHSADFAHAAARRMAARVHAGESARGAGQQRRGSRARSGTDCARPAVYRRYGRASRAAGRPWHRHRRQQCDLPLAAAETRRAYRGGIARLAGLRRASGREPAPAETDLIGFKDRIQE